MSTRGKIIARWQTQLAENEASLTHSTRRRDWVRKMYVRLYRFLLASYGRGHWRASVSGDVSAVGRTTLVDRTSGAGQPAKTADRIRSTLKKLHHDNRHQPGPGPLAAGVGEEVWIVLMSGKSAERTERTSKLLASNDIAYSVVVRRGLEFDVEVRLRDFERAASLIESHRDAIRRQTTDGKRRRITVLCRTEPASRFAVLLTTIVLGNLPLLALLSSSSAGFNILTFLMGGGLLCLAAGIFAAYLSFGARR